MALSIRAFCVGRSYGMPKPSFTYLRGWQETIDLPIIMFAIEGGESPIIVDTGADVSRAWDLHHITMEQTEDEKPDVALRNAGIEPNDVRIVINTHMHWDHSSNNHLFPNARVIVQRRELEYARQPVPWHCIHFEAFPDVSAAWRRAESQLSPIDGDITIAPGVTAVTLPGHTPGSQGVLVEAAQTRYLIAGDCIYLYENWEGDDDVAHIPVGLFTDITDYQRSLEKIESLECEVIPSHDFKVLERRTFA